jgi:isopropylmalate/homocitrate/citramalate synthase
MVDTIGVATPELAAEMVTLGLEFGVPVHWHGHDDFGLATAAAVAAVRAGADWVQGTVNGMGERAGNADLVECALTLSALYGADVNLDFGAAREISALVRRLAGYELEPWKAVVGENLFVRESGAVASQFHDPPAIEPFSSRLVGADRRMVLGKKSGLDSIRLKVAELGLQAPEDRWPQLLAQVKDLGTRKRGLVTDEEFAELVTTR